MQKLSTQKGFTLIELIIVIVLLGILAVTAAPRFLNLQDDARDAVLQGVAGSLESASSVVYGKALIAGQTGGTGTVDVGPANVTTVFGYPDAATDTNFTSILDADFGGEFGTSVVTGTPDAILIYSTAFGDYSDPTNAPDSRGAACSVEYVNTTSADVRPEIIVNSCVQ